MTDIHRAPGRFLAHTRARRPATLYDAPDAATTEQDPEHEPCSEARRRWLRPGGPSRRPAGRQGAPDRGLSDCSRHVGPANPRPTRGGRRRDACRVPDMPTATTPHPNAVTSRSSRGAPSATWPMSTAWACAPGRALNLRRRPVAPDRRCPSAAPHAWRPSTGPTPRPRTRSPARSPCSTTPSSSTTPCATSRASLPAAHARPGGPPRRPDRPGGGAPALHGAHRLPRRLFAGDRGHGRDDGHRRRAQRGAVGILSGSTWRRPAWTCSAVKKGGRLGAPKYPSGAAVSASPQRRRGSRGPGISVGTPRKSG